MEAVQFSVPALIKKVASGEKTHKDLTRDEARWIMARALSGGLADVQLGALLSALRLKGETVPELTGFLEAVAAAGERCRPGVLPGRPTVAHCGATSGKQRFFLAAPAAALVAAGAGVPVCIAGRYGREVKFPVTELEVFAALGVERLHPAAAAEVLDRVGVAVVAQADCHPDLTRLAELRVPLGMRTVAQSLEKFVFPVQPAVAVVGAFHWNYLQRLAEAAAALAGQGAWPERFVLLQERDGATDPAPAAPARGCVVQAGQVAEWKWSPEGAGVERYDPEALPGAGVRETAELTLQVLQGQGPAAHAEMVAYNAGLLMHAARPQEPPAVCVAHARRLIRAGAGLEKLLALRRVTGALARVRAIRAQAVSCAPGPGAPPAAAASVAPPGHRSA